MKLLQLEESTVNDLGLIFVFIIGIMCIVVAFVLVESIIDTWNLSINESNVITETIEATITHLDIEILSTTDKRYYASLICENDEAIVLEISESSYAKYNIGDKIMIEKETIVNTTIDNKITYSICADISCLNTMLRYYGGIL